MQGLKLTFLCVSTASVKLYNKHGCVIWSDGHSALSQQIQWLYDTLHEVATVPTVRLFIGEWNPLNLVLLLHLNKFVFTVLHPGGVLRYISDGEVQMRPNLYT